MQHFTYSEPGHNHRNEDAVGAQFHPDDARIIICVLADGQGGQFGGGAAARQAIKTCLELAIKYSPKKLANAATWREILVAVDKAVEASADAGFTTLIALCTDGKTIAGASCGDSATLLIRPKEYQVLTERQRKNPPIGSSAAIPITFSARCNSGDKILLVSDGVWRHVGNDAIAENAVRYSGTKLIVELRALQADQHRGELPDDFSIVLVES